MTDERMVFQLANGKWTAALNGASVLDLDGRPLLFDTEEDARAFLEESDARASSVDS